MSIVGHVWLLARVRGHVRLAAGQQTRAERDGWSDSAKCRLRHCGKRRFYSITSSAITRNYGGNHATVVAPLVFLDDFLDDLKLCWFGQVRTGHSFAYRRCSPEDSSIVCAI